MAESATDPIRQAHAEAYRAYLRSLRDSLANVDIEALDVSRAAGPIPPVANSLATFHTYYTFYTYHTFLTYQTFGTTATIGTESSIE
jgi:hypothetical protein